MSSLPLIAVDVGNSRIKLGLFRQTCADGLPEPEAALHLDGGLPDFARLSEWLAAFSGDACAGPVPPAQAHRPNAISRRLRWHIASVNRPTASRLIDWLRDHRSDDGIMLLTSGDLPLKVRLPRPDMVGVDRLLDAVAANRLRTPGRKAVVVDVGSAITVDLVDADGTFLGGAILPGIAMSARALHEFTDLLPQFDMTELVEPPPPLGTATVAAMRSGLFWGAVGAVRQLVEELVRGAGVSPAFQVRGAGVSPAFQVHGAGVSPARPDCSITIAGGTPAPQDAEIFLTGGAGPAVAQLLGASARFVPHLTLAGIALAEYQSTHHAPP